MLVMSKEPSKTDQLRAMREQRHSEGARPPRADKKAPIPEVVREIREMIAPKEMPPDLKPARPARNVATKGKKRAAEAIGKARDGKIQVSAWLPGDLVKRVRHAAIEDEMTMERFVELALRSWLERA
mgnify:CR=1 FL=1